MKDKKFFIMAAFLTAVTSLALVIGLAIGCSGVNTSELMLAGKTSAGERNLQGLQENYMADWIPSKESELRALNSGGKASKPHDACGVRYDWQVGKRE